MLTVIDLETTGLTAGIHEVCQISCILVDDELTQVSKFTSLVRPRRVGLIDSDALAVNGFTIEQLLKAPTSEDVRGSFLEWWNDLGQTRVYPCGWNYQFDRDFLRMMFGQVEYESLFSYKAVDVY
jgi:DNA polymerase III epsilon subunit-like protein